MITKKFILLVAIGSLFLSHTLAQSTLKIGQPLPNIQLGPVLNSATGTINLHDLRGKLVILDFWDIYCSSCIAAFPKMQQLQEEFGSQIQIILVTDNSLEQVQSRLARNGMDKTITLPMLVADTVLTRLFEYRTVPTHAWIDREGNLAYFTTSHGTTSKNIAAFLAGRDIKLPLKVEYRDFDYGAHFFAEGNGRQQHHVRAFSMLLGHVDDEGGALTYVTDSATGKQTGLRAQNYAIADLYKEAWSPQLDSNVLADRANYGNVILEVTDPSHYFWSNHFDYRWAKEHTYSYEALLPPSSSDGLYPNMVRNLDQFLHLKSRVERRKVPCLVLKRASPDTDILAKAPRYKSIRGDDSLYVLEKTQLFLLLNDLEQFVGRDEPHYYPVVNETGYSQSERVDIRLVGDLRDLESLQAELLKNGLSLTIEPREISLIVITELD